jgi:glutathione peroxidase
MDRYLTFLTLLSPALGQLGVPHISEVDIHDGVIQISTRIQKSFGDEANSSLPEKNYKNCRLDDSQNLYEYSSLDIEKQNNISLGDYKGNVSLVVNLASFWGYTPQYYSLNALMEKYEDQPFQILGFPCNQFLRQEPGANASEIYAVLKYIRPGDGFVPNFDMFEKTDVNGANQNPIYTFLKSRCDPPRQEFSDTKKYYYEPFHGNDIRWNFEKFLIDPEGNPIRRYDESLDPMKIVPDIDNLLAKLTK